ncbi:MAG TPA: DUF1254 domain-containing protein [Burkholderiaceae bacterium]|nr:DUF1254 domain-containing protein [Burkholderiaceae bacterium]
MSKGTGSAADQGRVISDARRDLAHAIGVQACLYGLPLVESMRTAAQMTAVAAPQSNGRAPLNHFGHSARPWTHEDRDVVTPANDLLYSMAWLDLSESPMLLTVPPEGRRYWVMALLDAYTNNFLNIGPRLTGGAAKQYLLTAPGWSGDVPAPIEQVRCATPLVWILGRVLVEDAANLMQARALQQRFTLSAWMAGGPASAGSATAHHSTAHPYTAWQAGDDPLDFFDNLARGLAQNPPPDSERGLVASFAAAGLRPGAPVTTQSLEPAVAEGLRSGFATGAAIVEAHTRSRQANPWGINYRLGRFDTDYLSRACTAAKGLGGVAADEALYAMADFDAAREPLDGRHRYRLSFAPGELPPCDAFWSVSLYGPDRFFVANPIGRHAIGDRTAGLRYGPDGSLDILVQHEQPADGPSNWLPAPAGPFYLILRMYYPRDELLSRGYRVPPVQRA